MSLGLVLLLMLLATVGTLLFAVFRKPAVVVRRVDYDMAVYRDQLSEIDKDVERGLLTAAQAEAARQEIHRRMLAADAEGRQSENKKISLRSRIFAVILIAIILPLGAAVLYACLGSPGLPGMPYASRINTPEFIAATEAEDLAEKLGKNPAVEGYKQLSLIYFKLGYDDKAAEAYQKAIMAMPPAEQHVMIQKMADRLATRLKDNPDDAEGWQRLANAYRVLGQKDKAEQAQNKANELSKR